MVRLRWRPPYSDRREAPQALQRKLPWSPREARLTGGHMNCRGCASRNESARRVRFFTCLAVRYRWSRPTGPWEGGGGPVGAGRDGGGPEAAECGGQGDPGRGPGGGEGWRLVSERGPGVGLSKTWVRGSGTRRVTTGVELLRRPNPASSHRAATTRGRPAVARITDPVFIKRILTHRKRAGLESPFDARGPPEA